MTGSVCAIAVGGRAANKDALKSALADNLMDLSPSALPGDDMSLVEAESTVKSTQSLGDLSRMTS
jgi:hypothetical protein